METEDTEHRIRMAEQSLRLSTIELLALSATEEGGLAVDVANLANVRWALEIVWDRAKHAQKMERAA